MAIRVVVADDHPVLLAGMEHLLASVSQVMLVGAVKESTELVALLGRQPCDVLVTDFSMPGGRYGDGIALLRFVGRRFPTLKRVVLTGVENPWVLRGILEVGVDAVISKAEPELDLVRAIESAHQGKAFLSPRVTELLASAPRTQSDAAKADLSKREAEVLRMFAEGLSVTEIGERVGRSPKTISTQKMSAMRKLGLARDGDILRYAIANGMIQASQVARERASGADVTPE